MMIKKLLILLFIFLAADLLADEKQAPKPAPEMKLAVIAPVTGSWGSYGNEIVRGAELAVSQSTSESQPVKLFVENGCLPAETVRSIHKLIDLEKIQAVTGSYCVIGMVPMAKIAEEKRILAFHTSAVADAILKEGNYTFTTNVLIKDEAKKVAEYAFNNLGARSAAVIYLLTQWGQDYQKYFIERFKELGGEIKGSLESQIGTSDFNGELTKVKSLNPDVVFIAEVGNELGTALKQARNLGLAQPMLGPHEAEEQSVIDMGGKSAEGFTFYSPELPESGEGVAKFREAYRGKYGTVPGILAANSFDATKITINSLRECNLSTECAKDKIYQVKDYAGVSGFFSITPEGGTVKNFVRKTIRNGKFEIAQ